MSLLRYMRTVTGTVNNREAAGIVTGAVDSSVLQEDLKHAPKLMKKPIANPVTAPAMTSVIERRSVPDRGICLSDDLPKPAPTARVTKKAGMSARISDIELPRRTPSNN